MNLFYIMLIYINAVMRLSTPRIMNAKINFV